LSSHCSHRSDHTHCGNRSHPTLRSN
jgi:hypothetical protein